MAKRKRKRKTNASGKTRRPKRKRRRNTASTTPARTKNAAYTRKRKQNSRKKNGYGQDIKKIGSAVLAGTVGYALPGLVWMLLGKAFSSSPTTSYIKKNPTQARAISSLATTATLAFFAYKTKAKGSMRKNVGLATIGAGVAWAKDLLDNVMSDKTESMKAWRRNMGLSAVKALPGAAPVATVAPTSTTPTTTAQKNVPVKPAGAPSVNLTPPGAPTQTPAGSYTGQVSSNCDLTGKLTKRALYNAGTNVFSDENDDALAMINVDGNCIYDTRDNKYLVGHDGEPWVMDPAQGTVQLVGHQQGTDYIQTDADMSGWVGYGMGSSSIGYEGMSASSIGYEGMNGNPFGEPF